MSSRSPRGALCGAAAALAALALGSSPPAAAQDPPSVTLPTIVVTPTGLPEPATEAGSAVTVIDRAEIDRSQESESFDILRRVPGLTATQSGGFGSESVVRLRGAESGQVQVLLDGVEVNDPSSAAGDFNFAGLLSTGIDRIEVLRGPQSALYGSDAVGGVVSLSTALGEGPPSGSVTGEYGSFDTFRGAARLGGSTERVAYGFSAAGLATDGFSRQEGPGFVEDDGTRALNLTGRAEIDLTANLSAEAAAGYLRNDAELDTSSADETVGSILTDLGYGRLALEHVGMDGRVVTTAEFTALSTDREVVDPERTSLFDGMRYEGDLRTAIEIEERFTLILGGGLEEELGSGEDEGGPTPGERFDESLTTIFAYGLARFEPAEGLVITAGGRIDDFEAGGTEPTYRFTGAYDIAETGTTLRASVGTAARAPTLFQLFDSFAIEFGGFLFRTEPNPALRTETSLGADVGIEQALFEDRLVVSATGFVNDFDDLIEFRGSRFENVAEARTYGVEVAATAAPTDWLLFDLSYTFLETEDDETGLDLRRRPSHSLFAAVDVQATEDLALVGELRYVGEQFDDTANEEVIANYTVVNLAASYTLVDRVQAFVRIENVFDEEYQEALGFQTAGRSAFGGIELSF
jgi:vitamin B12 transporter